MYQVDTELDESKAMIPQGKELPNPGKLVSIVIAGNSLLCGGSKGVVRTFNIMDGFKHESDVAMTGPISSVAVAGVAAIVAGPGYHVAVERSGESGKFEEVTVINQFHTGAIVGAGFANNIPISFDENGLGLMWDQDVDAAVAASVTTTLKPSSMSTCPSGKAVVVGTKEGIVNLYDVQNQGFRLVFSQQLHNGPITHIEYCRSGEYVFSVGAGSLVVTRASDSACVVGSIDIPEDVLALGCSSPETEDGGVRVIVTAPSASSGNSTVISAYFRPPAVLEPAVPFAAATIYYHETTVDFLATSVAFGRGEMVFVAGLKDRVAGFVWADNQFQDTTPTLFAGCPSALHPTLAMASGGHVLASLGTDGTLLVRSALEDGELSDPHMSFGHPLPPTATSIESVTRTKLSAALHAPPVVAVSSDGTKILTGSSTRGDLVCWQFDASAASAVASTNLQNFTTDFSNMVEQVEATPATAGQKKKRTAVDQLFESLEMAKVDVSAAKMEGSAGAEHPMITKIGDIREQLANIIAANEEKPELEKLDFQEFQLDTAARDRMEVESETKLQSLQDDLELQILAQKFLRNEIKKECWDAMEVKGKTLYALESGLEVSNYPIRMRSDEEIAELARVRTMRNIELAQEKAARRRLRKENAAAAAAPAAGEAALSPEPGAASPPPAPTGEDADDDDEEVDGELYNPLTLYGAQRKRAQIELLRNEIYEKQLEFNKEFEDLCQDKAAVLRAIDGKNASILKVVDELRLGGANDLKVDLFVAKKHVLETPESLLSVVNSEIKVVKVMNAAELIIKAEEDEKIAEQKRLDALDNPIARGIDDMLDGRLEEKGAEEVWEDLPVPEFLGTPEDRWTDAQTKIAKAYEVELKERMELREKRRKLIQSDLTSLKAGVATSIEQFDERMNQFFHNKIKLQQIFIREELKILKLAKALRDEQDILGQEQALSKELQALRSKIRETGANFAAAKDVVSAHEAEYTTIRRADTHLDKSFKTRFVKESSNASQAEDYIDMLVKLFKKRPRKSKIGLAPVDEELALDPSPEGDDYPEGLDKAVWDELVAMRNEKLASESRKREKEADVADKRAFLNRRKAEAKAAVDRQSAVLGELSDHRKSRLDDSLNLEIVVKIKQGQVEVAHDDDFEPNYDAAVLIHRDAVEALNVEVVKLAEVKVQHMTEKMKKQSGIHKLEWQHKRLGMEAEDLQRKTKDVQMLRVTRHMTLEGDSGSSEDRNRKANDVLEKTIKQQEELMKTQLKERTRQATAITRKIRGLNKESVKFEPEITELSNTVDERATMCRVHMAATGGKSKVNARLHAASSRRALVETVKAQADEISFLRDELERRRMKTFPAFIPGQHVAF